MKIIEKTVYMSDKGQITLPAAWRRKIITNVVRIRLGVGDRLEISPIETEADDATGWISVFDKNRDNGGRGLTADEFLTALGTTRKKLTSSKVRA